MVFPCLKTAGYLLEEDQMGNMLLVVGCVLLVWAMVLVCAMDTGTSRVCLLLQVFVLNFAS